MKTNTQRLCCMFFFMIFSMNVHAGQPVWTFEPLTDTKLVVLPGDTANVQYRVTNRSRRTHVLSVQTPGGVNQVTTGFGACTHPFTLAYLESCILSLQIVGNDLTGYIPSGPNVCEQGNRNQCYQPSFSDILQVSVNNTSGSAMLMLVNSPLMLVANGVAGVITVHNNSMLTTALNVTSNFTGTALDGNVAETGNTCAVLPPGGNCTLTFTPGANAVPQTDFPIQGSNTPSVSGAISIDANISLTNINPNSGTAAGGVGVTVTGAGLTGATSLTFDGIAATNLVVVNSTTVTAVTPAHAAGAVDVTITTPSGSDTLVNGYTYLATAIGQSTGGGVIGCLDGGLLDFISYTVDATPNQWGNNVQTFANDFTDGATNTTTIINTPGIGSSAAGICLGFEIDSQGNTPCIAGNACYNDWFLPARSQATCQHTNRVAIGGFTNNLYWSSTESGGTPVTMAITLDFSNGSFLSQSKTNVLRFRCIRTLS